MNYTMVTRITDYGPYVRKLILQLDFPVSRGAVSREHFCLYCERIDGEGALIMDKTFQDPVGIPSRGYQTITAAYPCDETGKAVNTGKFVALEIPEEPLGKRTHGTVLSSGYIENRYRVMQVRPIEPSAEGENAHVGMIFDTCTGEAVPETIGWQEEENAMRYGYFTPAHEKGQKLPLVIWLHGAGEGGLDTTIAYTGNRVTALSGPVVQRKFGGAAWVLAPQCPTVWMDDGKEKLGHSNRSIYVKPLKACIDGFIADHAEEVDTDRIYITGISNGGFMTVRMILDYPGFFAAGAPGCAAFFDDNVDEKGLEILKNTPLWFVHSKYDELVNPRQTSLPIYHRLKKAGAENAHLTYWEEVLDTTGEYKDKDGKPRFFFNHGVWVLMFNNAIHTEIDGTNVMAEGTPVSLWEWMGLQKK